MRKRKHLFCLILILSILVSFCPPSAFADGAATEEAAAQEQFVVPFEGAGGNPAGFTDDTDSFAQAEDPDEDDTLDIICGDVGIEDPDNSETSDAPGESEHNQDSGQNEIPDESEVPDEGRDPDLFTDPDETGASDQPVDTDEDAESVRDEGSDERETPDEDMPAAVRVCFVSAYPLRLTLNDSEGTALFPLNEEPAEETDTGETPGAPVQEDGFETVYMLAPGSYRYSAEARGFYPLRNADLAITEDPDGTGVTLMLDLDPLPCGFPGMPLDYVLSEEELAGKQALLDHDVVSVLKNLMPGIDYVEDEVFFLAEDEEYAQLVAEAFNAELAGFAYRVAVLRLRSATVLEAVTAAADLTLPFPAVSPNYLEELIPAPEMRGSTLPSANAQTADLPERRDWAYWRDELGDGFDVLLRDPDLSKYQYMHEMINSYAAWGVSRGAGVTVAVLDSGVAAHEDLPEDISRVIVNPAIDQGENPTYYHGTHVAGIIAARLGNSLGGSGVAPEADILSIQVLNSSGGGSTSDVIMGINAAIEHGGVDIINMSLGGKYYSEPEEIAVRDAVSAGITIVASMGNDSSNIMNYPATFNIPGVIAVGAVTRGGIRAGYSNFGPWEDIAAPGSSLWSAMPGNAYAAKSGTSMATPVVAGACALYMGFYGHTDPAEMERIVQAAVTDGVLDVSKFFERDTTPPVITVEDLAGGLAPYGAVLTISAEPGETILYTLDGSTPTVKDGAILHGAEYTGAFPLSSASGVTAGKQITVKAVRINGIGAVSRVAELNLTVDYAPPEQVVIREAPISLVPGGSAVLKAAVLPEDAKQTITWEIRSRAHAPHSSVNAKSGLLTTQSDDYGLIVVRAKSEAYSPTDERTFCDYELALKQTLPARKLRLLREEEDVKTLTLCAGRDSVALTPGAIDRNGETLDAVSFSWSSSNTKVVSVSQDGVISAVGKGTATVSCRVLDGSGTAASCTVTVKQLVTRLTISGPEAAAPGSYVTFKAAAVPSDANNKKVKWSVDDDSAAQGVTVRAGVLKVPKNLALGEQITLTARSDDGGAESSLSVTVAAAVGEICLSIAPEPVYHGNYTVNPRTGVLKSLTLSTLALDSYGSGRIILDTQAGLSYVFDVDSPVSVIWKSSNPHVASVDANGLLTAVGPGSAKITATVNDARRSSASVLVSVINPASSVTIVSSAPALYKDQLFESGIPFERLLGLGKSVRNRAVLGDAFGRPTVGSVDWGLDVTAISPDGSHDDSLAETIRTKKWITVSSAGTVSTQTALKPYLVGGYKVFATLTARTTDGTELEGKCTYYVTGLTKRIRADYAGGFTFMLSSSGDPWCAGYYSVTSSNPKAGTAKISGSTLTLYPNREYLQPGGRIAYSSFKISACDSSGRSITLRVGFSCDRSGNYLIHYNALP